MRRLFRDFRRLLYGEPEIIGTNEAVRRLLAAAELRDGPLTPPRKTHG